MALYAPPTARIFLFCLLACLFFGSGGGGDVCYQR